MIAAVVCGVWLAAAVPRSCASISDGEEAAGDVSGKLDPRLRRLAAERPDSVIGVLVRTVSVVDITERAALEAGGLVIGTVAGDVVTGRLRAGNAPDLARSAFVVYIELAQRLRPVRPSSPPSRSD